MTTLNKRASGVLMHISSLPGSTGIGTMGQEAFNFIDLLHKSNQTYWQLLPICPTGYGDSPYQSFSTFAGNPYFIDFKLLEKDGYLIEEDYASIDWGNDNTAVDYGKLYQNRPIVFKILQKNFKKKIPADFEDFCKDNEFWLDDYALFMAIKDRHDGHALAEWEEEIRFRKPEIIEKLKVEEAEKIEYYKMLQYFFFTQWKKLKEYANSKGICIIGDIPIYVSADSSDVWASPSQFALDEKLNPIEVAGCPPDGFSATGQLWGNPVYNWDYMAHTGYEWWTRRIKKSLETYDIIRIDHFRGFDSFYCIPAGAKTAESGEWKKGPGMSLFTELRNNLGSLPVIAEDLGFLTDSVKQLLKDSGFPGMKVLEFAFDSREENDYLPETYPKNAVVYTGTHDNDTILGWSETAPKTDVENALHYFGITQKKALRDYMIEAAFRSKANTCVITMQDILAKGSEARMNTPSTQGNNWKWRAESKELLKANWQWLKEQTEQSGRW